MRLAVVGALLALLAVFAMGMKAHKTVVAAPDVRVYGWAGKPKRVGYTLVRRVRVPHGKCLHVTNVVALAERHSGGLPDAGEFTVMIGDIAQSSLETGNGIAYQGQGMKDATYLPGERINVAYWLRAGKNPEHYYFTAGLRGKLYDCRVP